MDRLVPSNRWAGVCLLPRLHGGTLTRHLPATGLSLSVSCVSNHAATYFRVLAFLFARAEVMAIPIRGRPNRTGHLQPAPSLALGCASPSRITAARALSPTPFDSCFTRSVWLRGHRSRSKPRQYLMILRPIGAGNRMERATGIEPV